MKLVKYENAERFLNSNRCEVWEYPLGDRDINCGVAKITGRYPDTGYCCNEVCKELVYVVTGQGVLRTKTGGVIEFEERDVVLIDKGEIYYWDGNCTVVMPCAPAWYPEQHKMVE